jgi:hypothetical protein
MARRSKKRRKRRPAPAREGASRAGSGAAVAEPGEAGRAEQHAGNARRAERSAGKETARARSNRQAGQRRYRDPEERPKAPWAPFPLVELVVLVALILLVGGFAVRGHRGTLMIGAGLVLGTLAGLELSIREHFTGYRSHTALLSAAVALAVLVGLTLLAPGIPAVIRVVVAAAVFAAAARFLVRVFQSRSGLSFKFR